MTRGRPAIVILAAGRGKRMGAYPKPKVLHEIGGLSMLGHVFRASGVFSEAARWLVLSERMDDVAAEARLHDAEVSLVIQKSPRGTAHAVQTALEKIPPTHEHILILYGDTPLIRGETVKRLEEALRDGADCALSVFRDRDAQAYGRVLEKDDGAIAAIAEDDGTPLPSGLRDAGLKNGGLMGWRAETLRALLPRIKDDNPQKEFYLTDAVALAADESLSCRSVTCERRELLGANKLADLADLEEIFQKRMRSEMMERGARLIAPDTVHFSHDTVLEAGVMVAPYVVFGTGAHIGAGASIKAFSHIEGAHVGAGAEVGPFARLRPGARIGERSRIGNFVEVKESRLGEETKVNHLAYVGDSEVGGGTNIGAGVITCNYDGFGKHATHIGENAFIGSNSVLVAPLHVGDGAYVGSGSVIDKDVEPDALALGRARQEVKQGWAMRRRQREKADAKK